MDKATCHSGLVSFTGLDTFYKTLFYLYSLVMNDSSVYIYAQKIMFQTSAQSEFQPQHNKI